jgi:predicted small lipoprotein YifL
MRRITSLTVVLVLAGCAREAPSTLPDAPDVAPSPARATASRLSVPLEYDFTAVLRLVEEIVPQKFGSIDSVKEMGDNDRRHYAYEAVRGPFTAFADGNLMHLRATLTYQARGYIKPVIGPTISAGCGGDKDSPRLIVELATPLSLTDNWHLASHARVVSVRPATTEQRDHCDVSILHKDVTAQVVEAAQAGLTSQLPMIDRKIAGVDLKGHVAVWWAMLSKPIQLAPEVWIVLAPERLSIGKVRGQSKVLTVPVSLDAHPTIVTSRIEPVVAVLAVPPLGRDSATDGYHIVMDGVVDYGTASRELTAALSAKSFTQSGHTVSISSVAIIPQAKGRLGVSAVFAGDAKGTVHLSGTPRIDHAHDMIVVPDLDFDLRTDNPLLQSYSWLKSDALRTELRSRARIGTAPVLVRGKTLLLEGLNRKIGDALTLTATVDSVAVLGLFVTRDGMIVRAEARGQAGVSVKQ